MSVLSANVLQPNQHCGEVAAALAASDADVIGVVELSRARREQLERELSAWPHRVFAPSNRTWSNSTWGTGLFSKRPLRDARFVQLYDCYAPLIEARIDGESGPLTFRLVHLPRPGAQWRVEARNLALEQLAEEFEWHERCVLLGDLNTTSSSPSFGDLLARTGLADSRQGFGRQPSWWLRSAPDLRRAGAPPWLVGVLDLRLGIAIDHVLHGAALGAARREVLALPFSDHGGVRVEFFESSSGP